MIELTGVSLTLGCRLVLDGVGLAIAKHESVALVGPNGSGKTSVLRCLLGLVPFEGRAAIGGHDVLRSPIEARSLVGYLPQRPAFGDMLAREVLAFVAKLRRLDPARILPALASVGLEAHARERARTFSGGMQQRLSLAVALLTEAPVLLLDEPTASLDREGQQTFFEIVRRLRGEGRTLLMASHRSEEIERLTDRVIELDCGRVQPAVPRRERASIVQLVPKAAVA